VAQIRPLLMYNTPIVIETFNILIKIDCGDTAYHNTGLL